MSLNSFVQPGMPLSDILLLSWKKSAFDKTPLKFVPRGILNKLITKENVYKAMGVDKPYHDDQVLVEFIITEARCLFAIAVIIKLKPAELYKAMNLFRINHFGDKKLPIAEITGQQYMMNVLQGVQHQFEIMEGNSEPAKIWSCERIMNFQEKQGWFLAPILSTAESNQDFWDVTLPFIEKHGTFAEGSFGVVSKYEIHSDHFQDGARIGSSAPIIFAVKEIKVDNGSDRRKVAEHWASEVKAMSMLNKLNTDHIIRFITAFRRGNPEQPEHYIVTEWADGGNLNDLWRSIPNPPLTSSFVKEVIDQLFGISEAFCAAHYLLSSNGKYTGASYRHGDLKPANILWFKEGEFGKLKVCDWGEAKNKQVVTAMRHSKTSAEFGTRRYEPPEVETGVSSMLPGDETKRRSRLYDIWAIGCITLEFIVWLLYGVEGLDKFNKSVKTDLNHEAPFYQFTEADGKKEATVHNVVAHWMNYMKEDPACSPGSTAIGSLLELVQNDLLAVKLPRKGGTFAAHNLHQPEPQSDAKRQNMQEKTATDSTHQDDNGASGGQGTSSLETSMPNLEPPAIKVTPSDDETNLPQRFITKGPERLRADQLRDRLLEIKTTNGSAYWSTQPQNPPPTITPEMYSTRPSSHQRGESVRKIGDYGQSGVDSMRWTSESDNDIASRVFSAFKALSGNPLPVPRISTKLCEKCIIFRDRIWNVLFQITYNVRFLEENASAKKCDLCDLLWTACQGNWGSLFTEVTFERSGSFIKMNSGVSPVLSLSRSPDCTSKSFVDLPVGFAELPGSDSDTLFEILRHWLHDCEEKHQFSSQRVERACDDNKQAQKTLPTRLIDVGKAGDQRVRIYETSPSDKGEWIALSHQWGPPGQFGHFCTNTDNHAKFREEGISLEELPATFKDAVSVTRALGNQYLWIDSLCIIQAGKDSDFEQEGKRMEDVYSGARCVIAASRASGHTSGFLKPRRTRGYVALCREDDNDGPIYISEMIDNFKDHILGGALSKRGWVFQEHALARRTIFFDDHQTYWQCGLGVRCETMTVWQNDSAKLMGDPNFPSILDTAQLGEKIERFQQLYSVYSRLGLTRPYDRPMAIASLEKRLLRTLQIQGGFGIFDGGSEKGLLRRSLLWCRGKDTPSLCPIEFPPNSDTVPSWSWMARSGGIDYLTPRLAGFDWEDLELPWYRSESIQSDITLGAQARDYDHGRAEKGESLVILDDPTDTDYYRAMCVVLGVQKGAIPAEDKQHYVLLVVATKTTHHTGSKLFKRIGAGYLPGRCIIGDPVPINVC